MQTSRAPSGLIVPTTEQGYANYGGFGGYLFDPDETSPDLQWPLNIFVYDRMRRTDAKVSETLASVTYPVIGTTWRLHPGEARSEIVNHISGDLGIPVIGEPANTEARRKDRFSWPQHLRMALFAQAYGHMFFEKLYDIGDDGMAHLAKLAPRMPRTLAKINTERDGSLVSVEQWPNYWPDRAVPDRPLTADRLVFYTHEAEGTIIGSSLLRRAYRHWLLKDRLLRIDTMMAERNGMGLPVVGAAEGASERDLANLNQMAQATRAGPTSGMALPFGTTFRLEGVSGTLPNLLPMIQYHDEQIAAVTLAEFLKLGSSMTGSRSVGDTFIDFFTLALGAVVEEVCDVANADIVGNIVDLNWGPDEARPTIVAEAVGSDHQLTASAIKDLMEARAVTPDPALEDYIRQTYRLPDRTIPWVWPGFSPMRKPMLPDQDPNGNILLVSDDQLTAMVDEATNPGGKPIPPGPAPLVAPPVPATTAARSRPARVSAAAQANPLLPDRALHRGPNAAELAAGTDFRALDTQRNTYTAQAVAAWKAVRAAQIAELTRAVTDAAGDLPKLAALSATPAGADALSRVLATAAQSAAAGAVAEAARQGVPVTPPDAATLQSGLDARAAAMAVILATTLGQAASAKAVALTGGALSAAEVASAVGDHLNGLSDQYLTDQLGGTVQAAQNSGRTAVMAGAIAVVAANGSGATPTLWASEIADQNTCAPCLAIDGTQFSSLDNAAAYYPGGLYSGCMGGPRCRGSVIAVYNETPPATGSEPDLP